MKIKDRTGSVYTTNEGYRITIVKYIGIFDCDIQFENGLIIKKRNFYQVSHGEIKNPYHPSVFNIGYIGIGNNVAHIKRKGTKVYDCWYGVLKRCYDKKSLAKSPTYKNVTVCDDWHNFQTFASWYNTNYVEGWELDKDILSGNVRVYSPDTCCFVPSAINNLYKRNANKDRLERRAAKVAEIYKDQLDERVYNKLLNYEVKIINIEDQ